MHFARTRHIDAKTGNGFAETISAQFAATKLPLPPVLRVEIFATAKEQTYCFAETGSLLQLQLCYTVSHLQKRKALLSLPS